MPFKPAKCPNCAGDIQVPDDRDTAKCMYCGSDIIVKEAIRAGSIKNLNNIFEMAKTALESGNQEEGLKYINSYLEDDQNNAEAWNLKAQLICLKYDFIDISEVHKQVGTYMAKAIAIDDKYRQILESYEIQLAESLINYINSIIESYNEVKFKANTGGFHGVYYADAPEVKEKLKSDLYRVVISYLEILPKSYLKKALPKLKEINEWLRKEGSNAPVLDIILKEYDSNYVAPPAKTCFIATAAYGSPMASEVTILRTFRDGQLEKNYLGKLFVRFYYHISPPIATVIGKSLILKSITQLILKPIILMIKKYF